MKTATPAKAHRYLTVWAVGLALFLALVATMNFVVDPYGFFGSQLGRWNQVKPRPDTDLTSIKRAALERLQPTALIVGNSRADIGFDPDHPAWTAHSLSAFNLAVPGQGMIGVWQNLQWASKHTKLKAVLVGLDYMDFVGVSDWQPGNSGDPYQPSVTPAAKAKALVSLTALRYSLETLRIQSDPYAGTITPRGLNPLKDYIAIARHDGYYVLFRQRADENAKNFIQESESATFSFERENSSANVALRQILELCRREGIDLYLVIYPYHAQMQLLFYEAHLWAGFERWKRHLAAEIEQVQPVSRSRMKLLDFSGFNEFSTEAIPARGDKKLEMEFYWESGHFKKALGNRVLDRLFSDNALTDESGFGVSLTPWNVDDHNNDQRQALLDYRRAHPDMAAEARDIVNGQCQAMPSRARAARCPAQSSVAREGSVGRGDS